MIRESEQKYEVLSYDDFLRSYRQERGITWLNPEQYRDFLLSLYRHARNRSDAGTNVIIDTVEFDLAYEKYCELLNCSNVIKTIVYCPLEPLLKRIDRRNSAYLFSGRRPVLLAFQQFLQMYRTQTSPEELAVERTSTTSMRTALIEAGKRAGNQNQYQALYKEYVRVFGIDKDQEITVVPKQKYDLVINTKANSKKENVGILKDYMKSRR